MTRKHLLIGAFALSFFATGIAAIAIKNNHNQRTITDIKASPVCEKPAQTTSVDELPDPPKATTVSQKTVKKGTRGLVTPRAIPNYVDKGLAWLAKNQLPNGAWPAHPGMGNSYDTDDTGYRQTDDVKTVETDVARKVETGEKKTGKRQSNTKQQYSNLDPASTALAATAFMRAGNTLTEGPYRHNVRKALDFLILTVRETPLNSSNIGNHSGTQPQNKLGQNIDLAMTTQFLTRVLAVCQNNSQTDAQTLKDVRDALEKCVAMLQNSQQKDGSWTGTGWAPVLNSAMANNALEYAQAQGITVSDEVLVRSQQYQSDNVSEDGAVRTESAAGVELYALTSSKRANVQESKKAEKYLDAPVSAYKDMDAATIEKEMKKKGAKDDDARRMSKAVKSYNSASESLQSDVVLQGFGNNGGEEFLSYMMNSEACVAEGQQPWDKWHDKMASLFGKIQNPDGSWSGHHCITTNVFCTAAVIMTLTADRDPIAF
ncbi:MAG: hypothetical protein IT270_14360 [Saprospiraceae bacterium]|nr:hypothetical protein [Saprospiraceae bacterium]